MNRGNRNGEKFIRSNLDRFQFFISDRVSITQFLSLFNVIGQQLKLWESSYLEGIEMALPINVSSGVYFMYIDTDKGTVMKKILIK